VNPYSLFDRALTKAGADVSPALAGAPDEDPVRA